ncbi:MAG: hypothetical protein Q9217_001397 [Psora testacea]
MPFPKSKKRPFMQRKRHHVTDESGWVHVVPALKHIQSTNHKVSQLQSLGTTEYAPLRDVAERRQRYDRAWRDSECCEQLLQIIEEDLLPLRHIYIEKCVCLGLGSFTHGRESSRYQLSALIWILQVLGKNYDIKEVVFQDPAFTKSDVRHLQSMNYNVLDSPLAFEKVDRQTFLFAPHLDHNQYARALEKDLPALCIGNEVESLIEMPTEIGDREKATLQYFSKKVVSKPMPRLELDPWCIFTHIYWMKDLQPRLRQKQDLLRIATLYTLESYWVASFDASASESTLSELSELSELTVRTTTPIVSTIQADLLSDRLSEKEQGPG